MAGLFDDVPDAAPAAAPTPAGGRAKGGLFDDAPDAKAAEPSMLSKVGDGIGDVVQSAGAGIIRGGAGLIDLPQTVYGLADAGMGYLAGKAARGIIYAAGGTPASDRGIDVPKIGSLIPSPSDLPAPGETAIHALEAATQPLHKPTTTAGEYARTAAEFLPGAGKTIVGAVKNALLPAVVSETAGQATKGTALEPWARVAGGVGAGVGQAIAKRPGTAERLFDRGAGQINADEFARVQSLVSDAAGRGIALTWPEALQQVVGPRRMGDLLRVVEGQGGLSEFFARRPEQIRAAGQAGLDEIAAAGATPTQVGDAARTAAQAGVASTPEGQAVIRATQAVGPRVTADQAGQVIQREMREVADTREGVRSEQAARDYAAARAAPENIGIDRTITVERPGEPVITRQEWSRPQFEGSAPRPLDPPPVAEAAAPAGPESLARFIARQGGILLDGEASATDLHRFNIPGLGNVARPNGRSIDNHWREALIEAGYLKADADGGAARDITSELLRKLQNEQKGVPSYPIGAERQAGSARGQAGRVGDEYQAALSQAQDRLATDLRNAGVDPASVHPDIMERTLGSMMRGEHLDPLDAYERVVGAMRENPSPLSRSTTVTEEVSAPRFGQANPQPALDALDRQVRSAKGDVRSSLESIRRDLYEHGIDPVSGVRETDLTVEGLLHARERIDRHLAEAVEQGDRTKVRDLESVRASLDEQLKRVPEVQTADTNFAANSRPLESFGGNTPLGRVTARDERTGRMQTPTEQVPGQIQGASAAREFLANATPEARRAFQAREVTRILDAASGAKGGATAESIRAAMRESEDVLGQLPEAQAQLRRLAAAHDARSAIERTPLGRIAKSRDVKQAIEVLFPTKPVEGAAAEVGQAVSAISRSNPLAARQLVRSYLGTEFAEATQRLQSGPNQAGGAKFAAAVRGNGLQAENVRAALRALPNGAATEAGFSRLLDIMEATGTRQGVGSRTSFNNEALAEMKKGGIAVEAGKASATGGFALPGRIRAAIEDWQAGKNVNRLAELMTSAEGGRRLAQLATAKPGAATIALLNRLTQVTTRAQASGDRPAGAEGEPLKLTVRPVP